MKLCQIQEQNNGWSDFILGWFIGLYYGILGNKPMVEKEASTFGCNSLCFRLTACWDGLFEYGVILDD